MSSWHVEIAAAFMVIYLVALSVIAFVDFAKKRKWLLFRGSEL